MLLDEGDSLENENQDAGGGADLPMPDAGGQEGGAVSNAAQKGVEQASKKTKEKLTKKAMSAIKSGAAKQSVLAALGPILLYAFVILVILIIIIGIAMFLVTMPGMVMEQLKALFREAGNFIAAFFGADTTKQIENSEIYTTLDYLEQMGYDLKSEGFLTDFVKSTSELDDGVDEENGVVLDEKVGVLRDDNGNIITAKSDFIFTYMVSDNYVYTIKNGNLATQNNASNWFESIITGIATAIYKYYNFLFGPVFDFLGITDAVGETWGTGLLAFYYDNGVGVQGDFVNSGTLWNWDNIEIDTNSKKLLITKRSLFNNNNPMEFSLDGWTGRYGMPLEFLLSVHKATMMPDLAYDMATTFNTTVNIYLHDVTGEAIAAYKGTNGYITYEELNNELNGYSGRNWLSAAITAIDSWGLNKEEALAAMNLGIIPPGHGDGCDCVIETTYMYVDGSGHFHIVLSDDDGYYYEDYETGERTEVTDEMLESCEQYEALTKLDGDCKAYIKKVFKLLNKNNDYNFKAYNPYIANVKNHWYRDVYFVVKTGTVLDFVDYDYDYEIMTGERWTLYETDTDGNFVYYKLNDDGSTGEKYEGNVISGEVEIVKGEESESMRIASMGEDGTKVVKKAVTIKSSDTTTMEDLGWNKNTSDVWSAYEENTNASATGYERLYEDEEIADDSDKDVKEKLYINIMTTGNIEQTGEGQRTETNKDIKKMFLLKKYFRYDGTDVTAEVIEAMREKLYSSKKDYYGAVSETNSTKELTLNFDDAKYNAEHENGTYKVEDYVGNVVINQDSLNAFTMLENTHTLDADYIYRDFKELVVELGYFTKEELTDETPKLLQWLVPDTGSGGYPDRTLDKRENEYGTMIHSESDINANKKHSLIAAYLRAAEALENGEWDEDIDSGDFDENDLGSNVAGLSNVSGVSTKSVGMLDKVATAANIAQTVGSLGADFERISESGDGYDYKVKSGSVVYTHYYQFKGSYAEKTFTWSGQTKTLHRAACGPTSCVNLLTGYGLDVNPTDNIVGISFNATIGGCGEFMESYGVTGQVINGDYKTAIEEAFSQGRPIITLMNNGNGGFWTSGGHFVPCVGMDSNGNIITLDSGSSNPARHTYTGGIDGLIQTMKGLWVADEAPDGMAQESDPYTGYKGNEAVVSPVTGILLDYGTYEDVEIEEGDNVTEDPRVNVDLKYGFPNIYENMADPTEENGSSGENSEFESQIVSDKVGYAKILVLDAENYQKLESKTDSSFKSNSLVDIDNVNITNSNGEQIISNRVSFKEGIDGKRHRTSEDEDYSGEYDDWSMLDKTIYGYKEFAETYEKYGIAGYVVYIDGFKCELPDESLVSEDGGNDDDISSKIPSGEKLTIDSFKISQDNLESEDVIESKYESDENRKLSSEISTNKLNAEIDLKTQAASSIAANNLIFIKEGTIIGRTLTDKELIDGSDFRNGEYGTYEELRGEDSGSSGNADEEDDNLKLIGNYVRIIMKDKDGTTVENVEDYMKLDDLDSRAECDFEQLAYFLGCLEEGFYERMDQGSSYGVEVLKDGAGNTTAFGLTKAVAGLSGVADAYPSFGSHLAAGSVPKEEAQDVFILVLEAARETVQEKLKIELDEDDPSLFALIDLSHASPAECYKVIDVYNSKSNNLSNEEKLQVFKEHWGSNQNYAAALQARGVNRGILAGEGRFLLYQEGSLGDEVIFETETPWTEFCEGGGTYDLTTESSGFYHVEKGAYSNY